MIHHQTSYTFQRQTTTDRRNQTHRAGSKRSKGSDDIVSGIVHTHTGLHHGPAGLANFHSMFKGQNSIPLAIGHVPDPDMLKMVILVGFICQLVICAMLDFEHRNEGRKPEDVHLAECGYHIICGRRVLLMRTSMRMSMRNVLCRRSEIRYG